jgi:hypothetical protein
MSMRKIKRSEIMEMETLINAFQDLYKWDIANEKSNENDEKSLKTREDDLHKIREEFNQREV